MTKYGSLYHVTHWSALFLNSRRLGSSYCFNSISIHLFGNKVFCARHRCIFCTFRKIISLLNFIEIWHFIYCISVFKYHLKSPMLNAPISICVTWIRLTSYCLQLDSLSWEFNVWCYPTAVVRKIKVVR